MKVFKFGGASVRNAEAVRNLSGIIKQTDEPKLVVVVSAMGKTTNALEELLHAKFNSDGTVAEKSAAIAEYHRKITADLFPGEHIIHNELAKLLKEMETVANEEVYFDYNREYDRLVSYGELLSTRIIHHYLKEEAVENAWLDARTLIRTDSNFRAARVDLLQSEFLITAALKEPHSEVFLTQGFIGADDRSNTTTLGREGSDFTAAIFGYALDAEEVVTWKDVPGLFNADPKLFPAARCISQISFRETIELSYYGAKIIHPNTIKPLQNKNIPLKIKSFLNPEQTGSVINQDTSGDGNVESWIIKSGQVLISMLSREYEFITENSLAFMLAKFASYGLKINLMQNSAITFTACVDKDEDKIASLILELRDQYHIRYNENVELLTIRHFNENIINKLIQNREILVEQRNRTTVQYVMK